MRTEDVLVGVLLALAVFAAGFLLLGLLALVALLLAARERSTTRPCPRCARQVRVGELECERSGFRSIGAS
jgi:hypothetical protein